MFLDDTVLAGLLAVAATCAFFGGVGWFIYSDIQKHKRKKPTR
mgnify:CR=1 FL=1